MKKLRKSLSLIVAVMMAFSIFTGCANSSTDDEVASVTVASSDAEVTEAVTEATTT